MLFDVSADPEELRNLTPERPERVAEFRAAMQQWYEDHPMGGDVQRTKLGEDEEREVRRSLKQLGYLE
jgi:hypothetical protein